MYEMYLMKIMFDLWWNRFDIFYGKPTQLNQGVKHSTLPQANFGVPREQVQRYSKAATETKEGIPKRHPGVPPKLFNKFESERVSESESQRVSQSVSLSQRVKVWESGSQRLWESAIPKIQFLFGSVNQSVSLSQRFMSQRVREPEFLSVRESESHGVMHSASQRVSSVNLEIPYVGPILTESVSQFLSVRKSGSQGIWESESLQSYPRNILGWSNNHRVSHIQRVRESASQKVRETRSQRVSRVNIKIP